MFLGLDHLWFFLRFLIMRFVMMYVIRTMVMDIRVMMVFLGIFVITGFISVVTTYYMMSHCVVMAVLLLLRFFLKVT